MLNNEPVAWMHQNPEYAISKHRSLEFNIPLYTQDQLEEARKLGMQQERALWNLSESTQEIMNKPVAWNEEEFNAIAYSYRSWPMHDPKGVSEKYEELVNYVQSITHPVKELGYNDIMGTWWEIMPNAKSCEGVFEFARAILLKAQEK